MVIIPPDTSIIQHHAKLSILFTIRSLKSQREGIQKARAEGKYTGRKSKAMAKANSVMALLASGVSKAKICEQVGISRASLYRILVKSQVTD